jgi:arginyl-tRNA synthetase
MHTLEDQLRERLASAFAAVAGEPVDPVLRRSKFTDFQADGALALARRLGRGPRDIAADVVRTAKLADLCEQVDVTGPGFVSMTIRDDALGRLLGEIANDDRLGVPVVSDPDTVVIDYSSPNAAKEMHVGHIRSTILGDAIVRLMDFLGHNVVRQNHLGDWGTPFGMLVETLLDSGEGAAQSMRDLSEFYRVAREKFDASEEFRERSRQRVVLLQSGDETTIELWHTLLDASKKYLLSSYERLGVLLTAEDFVGESAYNDQLADVVETLDKAGLLTESDGATCVFPTGFSNRDGDPLPLIVRKSDGGFGYDATDLATIRHRIQELHGTRLMYVVGMPQRLHFQMVYETAREVGWLTSDVRVEHIGFGLILGADGKVLRSREGVAIRLTDLLDEAVSRAAAVIAEKDPDLSEADRAALARTVGVGAVKYADLSLERMNDYVFDYDRMLSLDGNSAPYLQFAHARIRSILRKAGDRKTGPVQLTEPAERKLALELLAFPDILAEVAESVQLHKLTGYLFGLATVFTGFYEKCPVLRTQGNIRDSRLTLCELTARTLTVGLGLLGIGAPDRM